MKMNQSYGIQNKTAVNSLKMYKACLQIPQTIGMISYPIATSPTRPSILTQQIAAYFQLSLEAWNHLSNQRSKKTN